MNEVKLYNTRLEAIEGLKQTGKEWLNAGLKYKMVKESEIEIILSSDIIIRIFGFFESCGKYEEYETSISKYEFETLLALNQKGILFNQK